MRLMDKSLIKSNMELWLNDKLLRAGLYENIRVGDEDFYRNNLSKLVPKTNDSTYPDGTVYQSAFKNWVYEENIPAASTGVAPPIVASGVTVNGTFYTEGASGTYEHFIDHPNGRVIFSSPISSSDIVEASFAYKYVTVDFADRLDNENLPLLSQTAIKDNPAMTGVEVYPDEENRTLPAIWIDFMSRDNSGYELGSVSNVKDYSGFFHIWAHRDFEVDTIEEIISDGYRDVLLGIDFNDAPFPLLAFGKKNPSWPGYSSLANKNNQYFWRRIYINTTDIRADKPLMDVQRRRVKFTARIYPNF